jgi:Fe-S cluster assembly iron-binding protein IscA
MITITQSAYSKLATMLSQRPDDVAARVIVRDGRMKLRPGREQPGDAVFSHNGRVVLLVGERVAKRLGNKTLDVRSTDNGPRLRFKGNRV